MADYLPPAIQEFIANLEDYDNPVLAAIELAEQFADRNDEAAAAARQMAVAAIEAADEAADAYQRAERAAAGYRDGTASLDAALQAVTDSTDAMTAATLAGIEALKYARSAAFDQAVALGDVDLAERLAAEGADALGTATIGAGAAMGLTGAQAADLRDLELQLAAAERAAAAQGGLVIASMAEQVVSMRAAADAARSLRDAWLTMGAAEDFITAQTALFTTVNAQRFAAFTAATRDANAGLVASFRGWGNIIHWILAFGAELAAVLIPAMVAFAAAAFVAMQGAVNLQDHLTSLFTATEATANMFGVTFGQAQGLTGAFQAMQDAANPDVYAAYGAALNILKSSFGGLAGAGLKVIQIFDTFAAKVAVDLNPHLSSFSSSVTGLLSNMIPDLVEIGQIFGNLGHAIVGLAKDMPGLAELLLKLADGFSQLLVWISNLPGPLITVLMVIEELYRWGGVLVSWVLRLSSAFGALGTLGVPVLVNILTKLGTIVQSVGLGFALFLENLGQVGAGVRILSTSVEDGTNALGRLATRMGNVIANVPAWQLGLGVIAAAAIGFMVYKLLSARSAAQQLTQALQETAQKASDINIYSVIGGNLGKLSSALTQNAVDLHYVAAAGTSADAVTGRYKSTLSQASGMAAALAGGNADLAAGMSAVTSSGHSAAVSVEAVTAATEKQNDVSRYAGVIYNNLRNTMQAAQSQLHAGMIQQGQDILHVAQGAAYLSQKYGISLVDAMALAQQAGVNLTTKITGTGAAAVLARMQISDLVTGMTGMTTPAGVVGKDMEAMAISAGLAQTKVSQLNQAWDQFMSNLTAGTSTLGEMVTEIQNIGQVTTSTAGKFGEDQGSFTLSINQTAKALTSFTAVGSQAWQNFDTVVSGSAQHLIDWLRTAGAEGQLAGPQLAQAVKDVVAQLAPFAARSKAAQAELLGLAQQGDSNITTWQALTAWIDTGTHSTKNLGDIIDATTQKMGDMAAVAAQLGQVMQNNVIAMMDKGELAGSKLQTAINTLSNAMFSSHPSASQVQTDLNNVNKIMTELGININTRKAILAQFEQVEANMRDKKINIDVSGTGQWQIAQQQGVQGHAHAFAGGFAGGGIAGGGIPGRDSVHALLTPGEGVLTTRAVSMVGPGMVHHLNAMAEHGAAHALSRIGGIRKFAAGGIVPSYGGQLGGLPPWAQKDYAATVRDITADEAGSMRGQIAQAAIPSMHGGDAAAVAIGRAMAAAVGWTGSQWQALYDLWLRESGWNPDAVNPSSAAYGIPQSLGHGHPYALGDIPAQVAWGLNYIRQRYGSPAAAWAHEVSAGWYDRGGFLPPGVSIAMNGTGRPEPVGAAAAGGGDLTLVLELNGLAFAKATLPDFKTAVGRYNRRNGNRMTGTLIPLAARQ